MSSADDLVQKLQGITAGSFANEKERIRARDVLFDTLRKVQSPWDIAWDQVWVSGSVNACIKTLIDAGVFTKWAEAGGEPVTCVRLAELTGADELLIRRLMRTIAGQNLVTEVAQDTYARTTWAKTLAEDKAFPGIYGGFYHGVNNPMFYSLPAYLKSIGFKNPADVTDGNWQFYKGKGANFFQDVGSNPEITSGFNDAMECHSKYNLTPWPEVYPTDTIVAAAKPDVPLVVDVGGNKGHDLEKFLERHPDIPAGSLILQDLPDILKDVKPHSAITVQPHDFFTPEPVKGARAYFMHNVLHDWPNETAQKILKTLAASMEKGYSRLLIHESLVSNEHPASRVTVSDITMIACLSAAERTEEQWKDLVASSGLRVIKIWRPAHSVESIIEAEVA